MLNKEDVIRRLKTVPFFSENNVSDALNRRFTDLKRVLEQRTEHDHRQLNSGNVTGVWYLPKLCFEEGSPQILVRTSLEKKSYEYLLLCAELHEFVKQDVAFHFDTDLSTDGMIVGQQAELLQEIVNERVFAIFDKERV